MTSRTNHSRHREVFPQGISKMTSQTTPRHREVFLTGISEMTPRTTPRQREVFLTEIDMMTPRTTPVNEKCSFRVPVMMTPRTTPRRREVFLQGIDREYRGRTPPSTRRIQPGNRCDNAANEEDEPSPSTRSVPSGYQ